MRRRSRVSGNPRRAIAVPWDMTSATPNLRRLLPLALAIGGLLIGAGLALACGGDVTGDAAKIQAINVSTLRERLAAAQKPLLVDVREPSEYQEVHIDGARLAPLSRVVTELKDVDKSREILLVCRSGRRSAKAYGALAAKGFTNLTNVDGGMLAWEKAGYPVVRTAK